MHKRWGIGGFLEYRDYGYHSYLIIFGHWVTLKHPKCQGEWKDKVGRGL